MQIRFTRSVGTPVMDDDDATAIGALNGIVLQPDTGKIEGFFVVTPGVLGRQRLFLPSLDIVRWGSQVHVRSAHVLSPAEDLVRLQTLLADGRPVLGQRIVTESGAGLGACRDVQFDTARLEMEWLFPRRFWKWSAPLPVSQIIEIRRDAVLVRDPILPIVEPKPAEGMSLLEMPDAA